MITLLDMWTCVESMGPFQWLPQGLKQSQPEAHNSVVQQAGLTQMCAARAHAAEQF